MIVLVAALLRLSGLSSLPLSREEAGTAALAFSLSRGEGPLPATDPAWAHVSPLLASAQFVLFTMIGGGGEALARLPSALAGTALVLIPWMLRGRLGAGTALGLAALIALDPVCVETSRRADGTALAALLAALALVCARRSVAAAIGFGLLCVTGTAALSLLPAVGLASLRRSLPSAGRLSLRRFALVALVAALFGASGFLSAWALTGGVSASLGGWLGGWGGSAPSGRVLRLGTTLPLALGPAVLGFVELSRGRRLVAIGALAGSLLWAVGLAARPAGDPAAALLATLALTAAAAPAIAAVPRWWAEGPRASVVAAAFLLAALAVPGVARTGTLVAADGLHVPAGARMIGEDLERLSLERAGDAHTLPVDVLCQPHPDPLLRWTLREFRSARFHDGSLDPRDTGPSLVVGPEETAGEPCAAPASRRGARYRASSSALVLWVPLEP